MLDLQSKRKSNSMSLSAMPRQLSPRQLEANRRNAQKSTGPRTEAGKKAVRLNARRHDLTGHVSILHGADRTAIETFCKGIISSLSPGSVLEMQLARAIAEAQWRLNRSRAIEDNFFALHIADHADHSLAGDNTQIADALHQAQAFFDRSDDFNRLTLYEQRIQRAMAKNLQLLNESKQYRLAAEAQACEETADVSGHPKAKTSEAKTNEAKTSEAKANSGFVFSIAQSPAPQASLVPLPPEPCAPGRSSN
jgi:hypothetical protein